MQSSIYFGMLIAKALFKYNIMHIKNIQKLIVFTLFTIAASSCSSLLVSPTFNEYDEVKGLNRSRKEITYIMPEEWFTPFKGLNQVLVKEGSGKQMRVQVFDELVLNDRQVGLEDTVYYIVNNRVFPIPLDYVNVLEDENYESTTKTDEEEQMVREEIKRKVSFRYRIEYQLSPLLVNEILKTNSFRFRYYSGPYMMTFKSYRTSNKLLKRYLLN